MNYGDDMAMRFMFFFLTACAIVLQSLAFHTSVSVISNDYCYTIPYTGHVYNCKNDVFINNDKSMRMEDLVWLFEASSERIAAVFGVNNFDYLSKKYYSEPYYVSYPIFPNNNNSDVGSSLLYPVSVYPRKAAIFSHFGRYSGGVCGQILPYCMYSDASSTKSCFVEPKQAVSFDDFISLGETHSTQTCSKVYGQLVGGTESSGGTNLYDRLSENLLNFFEYGNNIPPNHFVMVSMLELVSSCCHVIGYSDGGDSEGSISYPYGDNVGQEYEFYELNEFDFPDRVYYDGGSTVNVSTESFDSMNIRTNYSNGILTGRETTILKTEQSWNVSYGESGDGSKEYTVGSGVISNDRQYTYDVYNRDVCIRFCSGNTFYLNGTNGVRRFTEPLRGIVRIKCFYDEVEYDTVQSDDGIVNHTQRVIINEVSKEDSFFMPVSFTYSYEKELTNISIRNSVAYTNIYKNVFFKITGVDYDVVMDKCCGVLSVNRITERDVFPSPSAFRPTGGKSGENYSNPEQCTSLHEIEKDIQFEYDGGYVVDIPNLDYKTKIPEEFFNIERQNGYNHDIFK